MRHLAWVVLLVPLGGMAAGDESKYQAFPTTHVSLVEMAARRAAPGWEGAWEQFFRGYWRPLYAYLRRTGSQSQEARDLLQEFFLAGAQTDLLARYDPKRGRLRTFLLTCLTNQRRKAHRKERGRPDRQGLPWLNDEEQVDLQPVAADPEEAFERDWNRTVQERAIAALDQRLKTSDPMGHRVLHAWVLCVDRPPAAQVAKKLKLTPGALYTRATRLRQALVEEVEGCLRWFASRPDELASERDAVLRLMRESP